MVLYDFPRPSLESQTELGSLYVARLIGLPAVSSTWEAGALLAPALCVATVAPAILWHFRCGEGTLSPSSFLTFALILLPHSPSEVMSTLSINSKIPSS